MSVRATAGLLVVALFVASTLGGCGDGGGPGSTLAADEKAHDVEIINVAITQDLTLTDVYRHGGALLKDPELRAVLRQYVAQEQEHIDGWTKAMRGLGGQVEAEAEEIDYSEVKTPRDYLLLAYEETSLQLTHFLEDVTQLSTPAPQSFAASIAANEAQHLVVLRQALGADLLEAVPDAFDTGEVPPPGKG
jgi:rubrerythrin